MKTWHGATLAPGDADHALMVFQSTKAACATCHALGYKGGTLGPDLSKVGATARLLITCVATAMLFSAGCRDYDKSPVDRAALQRMVDPIRDVPAAFEAHKAAHGSYPLTVADLDRSLPKSASAVAALHAAEGFVYSSGGDAFTIYRKLNWDGGIVFSSMNPKWLYTLNEDKEIPIYTP